MVLSFLTCVFVFRAAVYVVVVHRIGEFVSVDSSCYLINSLRLTKVRDAPKDIGKKTWIVSRFIHITRRKMNLD